MVVVPNSGFWFPCGHGPHLDSETPEAHAAVCYAFAAAHPWWSKQGIPQEDKDFMAQIITGLSTMKDQYRRIGKSIKTTEDMLQNWKGCQTNDNAR
jgi:hypothetical protein